MFTAMDAWFYCCKLLVIGALFEFACLLHMRKKAAGDRPPFLPMSYKQGRPDSGLTDLSVPVMEGWGDEKGRKIYDSKHIEVKFLVRTFCRPCSMFNLKRYKKVKYSNILLGKTVSNMTHGKSSVVFDQSVLKSFRIFPIIISSPIGSPPQVQQNRQDGLLRLCCSLCFIFHSILVSMPQGNNTIGRGQSVKKNDRKAEIKVNIFFAANCGLFRELLLCVRVYMHFAA